MYAGETVDLNRSQMSEIKSRYATRKNKKKTLNEHVNE